MEGVGGLAGGGWLGDWEPEGWRASALEGERTRVESW